MKRCRTKAQIAYATEQSLLDFAIEKHKKHKELINAGIVRIIVNNKDFVQVFVCDILVHYGHKDTYTKYRIDEMLDTVVAMKSWTVAQVEKMQCCGSCKHFNFEDLSYCRKGVYRKGRHTCSKYEMREDWQSVW